MMQAGSKCSGGAGGPVIDEMVAPGKGGVAGNVLSGLSLGVESLGPAHAAFGRRSPAPAGRKPSEEAVGAVDPVLRHVIATSGFKHSKDEADDTGFVRSPNLRGAVGGGKFPFDNHFLFPNLSILTVVRSGGFRMPQGQLSRM